MKSPKLKNCFDVGKEHVVDYDSIKVKFNPPESMFPGLPFIFITCKRCKKETVLCRFPGSGDIEW